MRKSLPFVLLFSAALAWETGCKPQADRLKDEQAASTAQVEPVAPQMPDQVAKVGVGVRGDSLDDISGDDPRLLIAGPAKAYFNVKERVVFDIQLPHAANLYNALNSRDPKTHEEYMREIVVANKIELPKLREGMVYRYHPDTKELWVESDNSKP